MLAKISEDQIQNALDLAAAGASMANIAKSLCLSNMMLAKCMSDYPEFGSRLRRAREIGLTVRAEAIRDRIELNDFSDSNHLRVWVDNEKWLLSKLMPQVFGDRIAVQVETVDVSGALQAARQRAAIDITPKKLDTQ